MAKGGRGKTRRRKVILKGGSEESMHKGGKRKRF
jgi:hypothetical protein